MSNIEVKAEGSILRLILNRPEKRNALTDQMFEEIIASIEQYQDDSAIKAIVIQGAGSDFCSGRDIESFKRIQKLDSSYSILNEYKLPLQLNKAIANCKVPIIAMVRGYALGAGAGIVSWCDIAIAENDSKFGYSEINIGLAPSMVSVQFTKDVPRKQAVKLLLTGEMFGSVTAKDIGLITEYCSADELENRVLGLVSALSKKSRTALRLTKDILNSTRDMSYFEAITYAHKIASIGTAGAEAKEGINAFLEKRKPVWD